MLNCGLNKELKLTQIAGLHIYNMNVCMYEGCAGFCAGYFALIMYFNVYTYVICILNIYYLYVCIRVYLEP